MIKRRPQRRRRLAVIVTGCAAAAVLAIPAGAGAADKFPCARPHVEKKYGAVQNCPLWGGVVPVHASPSQQSRVVGTLFSWRSNWFYWQTTGGRYSARGYTNIWWAYTVADNRTRGYVSEVWFRGGPNDDPDPGLALKPSVPAR